MNRLFKMPINQVKHSGFELRWIQMYREDEITHGYTLLGPIGDGVMGPFKFGQAKGDSPEGYSFALTLREALLSIYTMCDIVEEALGKEQLLEGGDVASEGAKDPRAAKFHEALEALNQLPLRSFPDEAGSPVPIFQVTGPAVFAQRRFLRSLPGTYQITSEIGGVGVGTTHRLPYWTKDAARRKVQVRRGGK